MNDGKVCGITQGFGENKNRFFYGPLGHRGLDFRTKGGTRFNRSRGKMELRTSQEQNGRIPIVAAHDGVISLVLHPEKQRMGWGLYVTAEQEIENGLTVRYRTLYWHIETPWGSLARFKGVVFSIAQLIKVFSRRRVREGAKIAIGGDNGLSTGPHLHFEIQRQVYKNGFWTDWERLDPLPRLRDKKVLVHLVNSHQYYYQGEEISKTKYNSLLETL